MPFTMEELNTIRPYVYHVSGAINFHSIQTSRQLKSARDLLINTRHKKLLLGRRSTSARIEIDGQTIEIRDHRPLIVASLSLPTGYSVDQFIAELNSRVFFWAGNAGGPIRSGQNHITRYSVESEVFIIRTKLDFLLRANPNNPIEVTFCNSGSARHNKGRPAYRSPNTFMPLNRATRKAADVVEVTFAGQANLPMETEYAKTLSGSWQRM